MKIKNMKKFQHSSNWVMMLLIVITVAIVFNLVVDLFLEKFPVKIDLTPNKILELTDETKTMLSKLDKDVHIIVFKSATTDLPYVDEILDRYKRENSRITWEYIDPVRHPSYTSKYSTIGNTLMHNSVVVESGDKFKLIQAYDIFPPDAQGNLGATIDAEGVINSAITYVTSEKNLKVGFVKGHGETEIEGPLGPTLKREYIDYEEISLLTNDIPDDFDYIVIAGARTDFQPIEIDRLDNFLQKGKAAQVLCAIDVPPLPRLDSYLNEWGIVVNRDIIKETNTNNIFGNNSNQIIAQYIQNEITNKLIANQLPLVMPMVRSITTKWEDQFNVKLESILKSSSYAIAKSNPLSTSIELEEGDSKGPHNIAVLGTRTFTKNNEPIAAGSLFVIGTANLYDELFVDYNIMLFMNAISAQIQQTVMVSPKSLVPSGLVMNLSEIILCSIIVVFIIPLSILVWGFIVWLKRRHL